jgi:hypothetical protein
LLFRGLENRYTLCFSFSEKCVNKQGIYDKNLNKTLGGKMKLKTWSIIVGLALILSMAPAISQAPEYLSGTVLSIRDENSMYVNFPNSNIPGMQGATLILLPRPVIMRDLLYFQGRELSFSLLGHDILGRPVCNAYFEGMPIEYFERYWYFGYY